MAGLVSPLAVLTWSSCFWRGSVCSLFQGPSASYEPLRSRGVVFGLGAGKTSLVRLAAALAGQPLVELALSAGTDTADLLGGFEQLEPLRRVQVLPCSTLNMRKLHSSSSSP